LHQPARKHQAINQPLSPPDEVREKKMRKASASQDLPQQNKKSSKKKPVNKKKKGSLQDLLAN
jgi:hypothetical protein